jgi:phosphatidylserine/phosphatidylglycerophosphate/cardiolipin synthase-like enzyme
VNLPEPINIGGNTIKPTSPLYPFWKKIDDLKQGNKPSDISDENKDIDSIKKSDSKKKDDSGVKMSPYLEKYGYMPDDPDYYAISSDITGKKEQITTGMKDIITGSQQAFQYNRQMIDDIKMIQNAPSGSTFTIGEQSNLSKEEALGLIINQIQKNVNVTKQVLLLPSLGSQGKSLINLENTVGECKRRGYTVDIITDDKGSITDYEFGLPKASDVHSWYWNDRELEKRALTSAAFMESILAIGTLIDAGAGAIIGDKKWGGRRL